MGGVFKTWEQYKAECEAVAKPGIKIIGYVEPWRTYRTKLICECEKHGEWKTTTIERFKKATFACPACAGEAHTKFLTIDDSKHIESFLSTGAFAPGTEFKRSATKGKFTYKCGVCSVDEYVKAGLCTGIFESYIFSLKKGGLSCRCRECFKYTPEQWEYRLKNRCSQLGYVFLGIDSNNINSDSIMRYICSEHGSQSSSITNFVKGVSCPECKGRNHKEAYISILGSADGWNNIKFGIARDSLRRVRDQQNKATSLKVKSAVIYSFPTVKQCRAAERAVFTRLADHVGSVPKSVMPDGYTETLPISFMNQVIEIYKEHGGKLKPVSLVRPKRKAVRNAG